MMVGSSMRIGSIELASPLFLSPLAGYTNLPMRLTVRELGGLGWATTDLVNARSLIERNPRALQLVATAPGDQPLAIQLFGAVPEEMRDAALICESLGAHSVDITFIEGLHVAEDDMFDGFFFHTNWLFIPGITACSLWER